MARVFFGVNESMRSVACAFGVMLSMPSIAVGAIPELETIRYCTLVAPNFMELVDLNGDDLLDAVIGSSEEGMAVHFGLGLGAFSPQTGVALDGIWSGLGLGDLTGDGVTDIVALSRTRAGQGGEFVVLANDGFGTFSTTSMLAYESVGPTFMKVGDMSGDGFADLVFTAAGNNRVTVFLGDGRGTISLGVEVPLAGAPGGITVQDADDDGDLDIVTTVSPTANPDNSKIITLLNEGTGLTYASLVGSDPLSWPLIIESADISSDGILDIVVSSGFFFFGEATVLEGDGSGGYSVVSVLEVGDEVPIWARSFDVADIDLDGQADLLVASSGGLILYRGAGGGAFGRQEVIDDAGSFGASFADMNGDGALDIVGIRDANFLETLINQEGPWSLIDLGSPLVAPYLLGGGFGIGESEASLSITSASPFQQALLVIGSMMQPLPLMGSVLLPTPDLVLPAIPLNGEGSALLNGRLPAVVRGTQIVFQSWITSREDATSLTPTNGLVLTTVSGDP